MYFGVIDRDRTGDHRRHKPILCQLSYDHPKEHFMNNSPPLPGAGRTRRPTPRVRAVRVGQQEVRNTLILPTQGACSAEVASRPRAAPGCDDFLRRRFIPPIVNGKGKWARTTDRRSQIPVLYQLSYPPIRGSPWWARTLIWGMTRPSR